PPRPTRLPYTTLFRSGQPEDLDVAVQLIGERLAAEALGLGWKRLDPCLVHAVHLRVVLRGGRGGAAGVLHVVVGGSRCGRLGLSSEEHTSELQSSEKH